MRCMIRVRVNIQKPYYATYIYTFAFKLAETGAIYQGTHFTTYIYIRLIGFIKSYRNVEIAPNVRQLDIDLRYRLNKPAINKISACSVPSRRLIVR